MDWFNRFTLCILFTLLQIRDIKGNYFGHHHCLPGRDVFVHLFEWKWTDIANECENFLQYHGYCAVQVSPITEHRIFPGYDGREPFPWWYKILQKFPYVSDYFKGYPWWQRYQPVSYDVISRSGNQVEFRDMVRRCNNVGIRIYVDLILNHMTAPGVGIGSGGSIFAAEAFYYPGVPYDHCHFHTRHDCPTSSQQIEDFDDVVQLRNCRLCALMDLNDDHPYVQEKQINLLNTLIDWGVAGFRIDAAKHMWPHNLHVIYDSLHPLSTRWFDDKQRPFIYQEVIDLTGKAASGGDDYNHLGAITEFRFCYDIAKIIRKKDGHRMADIPRFTTNFQDPKDSVVFIDNHDNQRGHGPGGLDLILTHFEPKLYKMALAVMLAWPYGYPRIMSSYKWPRTIVDDQDVNDWIGPPSIHGHTKHVTCFDEWVCEHRWSEVLDMVKFHNFVSGTAVDFWWDNGGNAIAFSRGGIGFFIMNNEDYTILENIKTGLPDGEYCDTVTCDYNRPINGECISLHQPINGTYQRPRDDCRRIYVTQGRANFALDPDETLFIALHV